jgi:hypothetical protein
LHRQTDTGRGRLKERLMDRLTDGETDKLWSIQAGRPIRTCRQASKQWEILASRHTDRWMMDPDRLTLEEAGSKEDWWMDRRIDRYIMENSGRQTNHIMQTRR